MLKSSLRTAATQIFISGLGTTGTTYSYHVWVVNQNLQHSAPNPRLVHQTVILCMIWNNNRYSKKWRKKWKGKTNWNSSHPLLYRTKNIGIQHAPATEAPARLKSTREFTRTCSLKSSMLKGLSSCPVGVLSSKMTTSGSLGSPTTAWTLMESIPAKKERRVRKVGLLVRPIASYEFPFCCRSFGAILRFGIGAVYIPSPILEGLFDFAWRGDCPRHNRSPRDSGFRNAESQSSSRLIFFTDNSNGTESHESVVNSFGQNRK